MKKLLLALALAAFASDAAALGVVPPTVSTGGLSRSSPAHYVVVTTVNFPSVANGNLGHFIYPFSGSATLVDVIVYQASAGVGGTSFTVDIKNAAGTSLFTTLPVITLASGADKLADAKAELALPSGWTRQVLKTDATVTLTKGQRFTISTVETGTYSTHAQIVFSFIFEPKQ
jgi:hypothetical protein